MLHEIFDPASILQAAEDAEQTSDFWGDGFREGFDVLVSSMATEAGLYPAGAWRMARWMLEILGTRAHISRALKARPEVRETPIQRPVFITGLPRAGMTVLHNLLAGLPGFQAFRPWEMRFVVPPPDAGPSWEQEAAADTEVEIRALYARSPELTRIHLMSATAPDECHWLTRHTFGSLIFSYTLHTPSYTRWLLGARRPEVYAEYKAQLQLLRSWRPEGRLVMKDPGHLWHLDELLSAFPDALVVRLHRDPREAVPSLCSLIHVLQRMDSARVDPREVGPFALEVVERGLRLETEARARHDARSFLDVEYRDLVRDPMATVLRICAAAGVAPGAGGASSIARWLGEHPQNKAGRHLYSAEQFGLTPGALVERLGEQG